MQHLTGKLRRKGSFKNAIDITRGSPPEFEKISPSIRPLNGTAKRVDCRKAMLGRECNDLRRKKIKRGIVGYDKTIGFRTLNCESVSPSVDYLIGAGD